MNAPLIFDERDCDQNEYDYERDALFILRQFENPEQTFHVIITKPSLAFALCYFYPVTRLSC